MTCPCCAGNKVVINEKAEGIYLVSTITYSVAELIPAKCSTCHTGWYILKGTLNVDYPKKGEKA